MVAGVLAEIGPWEVVQTAIVTAPALLAAWAAMRTRRDIRTPSGTPIGTQVEDAQHVALANHFRLRTMQGDGEPASHWETSRDARADDRARESGT